MVSLERLQYRPEIDGLRAVAVLAVIINHFDKRALPYGYLGVDIFFVISGFFITATLVRQNDIGLGSFLVSFYSRRLRRLMPALIFVAAISSFFVCVFHPDPKESILTGVASLFGLSNLFLLKQSTDYFAASTELNAFTHTWSLGVEEQFYFVLPIMTYFLLLNKHGGKAIRNFGLTIAAFAIGSWLLFYHIYETNQALAYFSMPPRFWELAAGCLIYLIYTTKAANYVRKYIHALILLILLVVALSLPQQVGSPVFRVTAVVLLTSLLILVVRKGSLTHSLLSNKLFVFIGIISYSLYLWHWPILSLSRLTIGVHYFTIPAQLLLIFALASLTFYKIETPFRSGNRGYGFMDFHPLSKVLYAGLAVSAAMLFLAYKASHRIYVGRILNVDYPIWIRKPWFAGANGLGIDVCSSGTEITVQQAQDCLKLNPKSLTTAYVIGGQCPFVWCKTFGPNALIRG